MRAALALTAMVLTGCPGSLDSRFADSGPPMSSVCSADDMQRLVFNASCTMAGCHDSSNSPSGGLDLLSPGAEQRIVGIATPAGQTCSSSNTPILVVPGDPSHSLLLLKVEPSPPCGSRMPFGAATALTDSQIECVRSWIASLPSTGPYDSGAQPMDAARDVPAAMDVQHADTTMPMDTMTRTDTGSDTVPRTDTGNDTMTRTDTGTDVAADHASPVDTGTPDSGAIDGGSDP